MSHDLVICKCSHIVGEVVQVKGIYMLSIHGIYARAVHGVCSKCGEEFHWSMSEASMRKLMAIVRAAENRV